MRRREFLGAMSSAMAAGISTSAWGQAANWPDKPVKLIVPYAPGGATDLMARPWAEKLSQALGQQFVIENRGGAAGMIGTEAAARSAPDGYTFLFTPGGPLSVIPHMRKTAYDPFKSFQPVARVGDLVCGFTAHPSLGVKTLAELIDHAKKNPGKISYGSAGTGSSAHLRIEMLKYRAGIDILHVPYRGSADALNDLLPGTVQLMNEINVIPHVKNGKLNLLDINYPTRHPDFPNTPTLTECGFPDSDVPIWYSIMAPAGMPAEIITRLNKKVVEIAATDEMKTRMQSLNVVVPIQTPDEIAAYLVADSKANADLIKAAKITME